MNKLLIAPRSLLKALGSLRVLLLLQFVTLVPALVAVMPYALAADKALAQHPDATVSWSQALDPDLERLQGLPRVAVLGTVLATLCGWLFLTGGIVAYSGKGKLLRMPSFMAECGRYFFRMVRVAVVVGVVLLLVSWGYDRGKLLLDVQLADQGDPWRAFWIRSAVDVAYALLVLGVSFVGLVACALLVLGDRSSALAAWFRALWDCVRQPVRSTCGLLGMVALAAAGTVGFGRVTSLLIEERGQVLWGLLAGQAGIVWMQACGVALLFVAREIVDPPVRAPLPAKTIPAGKPKTDLSTRTPGLVVQR